MIIKLFINPGLELLPQVMRSNNAKAFLTAIGLQETDFKYRFQIHGPARGFWSFELFGGTYAVFHNNSTKYHVINTCHTLRIPLSLDACFDAIPYNDPLACVFARLLIWTLPYPLPDENEPEIAWTQYLEAWKPGKPRKSVWKNNFSRAWELVKSMNN